MNKTTTAVAFSLCLALALALGTALTSPARASSQPPFVSPDLVAQPIAALPTTITSPGLYRVTGDLTDVVGQDGISVDADHVTIDLGGFTLSGAGSGRGIHLEFGRDYLTVANGRVTNWEVGVSISGGGNVRNVVSEGNTQHGFALRESVIEGSKALDNGAVGIRIFGDCVVRSCFAVGNGDFGILAPDSVVEDCVASSSRSGSSPAFLLRNSVARNCRTTGAGGEVGFRAVNSTLEDCDAVLLATGFELSDGSLARRCKVGIASVAGFVVVESRLEACTVDSSAKGIELTGHSSARDCNVTNTKLVGIDVGVGSVAAGCAFFFTPMGSIDGDGFWAQDSSTIRDCNVDSAPDDGIEILGEGATVTGNTVRGAGDAGIVAASHGVVSRNLVTDCAGAAIFTEGDANRIESNSVRNSAFGFRILGQDNLLFHNDNAHNQVEYTIQPGNTRGPWITDQNYIQSKNPYCNFELTF